MGRRRILADPDDGQVELSWSARRRMAGRPITGYAYRYSADGGTTWSHWTGQPRPM